jgi:hypothetical protein
LNVVIVTGTSDTTTDVVHYALQRLTKAAVQAIFDVTPSYEPPPTLGLYAIGPALVVRGRRPNPWSIVAPTWRHARLVTNAPRAAVVRPLRAPPSYRRARRWRRRGTERDRARVRRRKEAA